MSREVINRMSAEFGKQIADLSMKLADARVIGSLKDDAINQLQSEVARLTEELNPKKPAPELKATPARSTNAAKKKKKA